MIIGPVTQDTLTFSTHFFFEELTTQQKLFKQSTMVADIGTTHK